MRYHEVSKAMNEGKKIKLKDWDNAYWYKKGGIIINHDEEGFECDTREIFPFDLMWVANGDWEIVVENLTPMNGCLQALRTALQWVVKLLSPSGKQSSI